MVPLQKMVSANGCSWIIERSERSTHWRLIWLTVFSESHKGNARMGTFNLGLRRLFPESFPGLILGYLKTIDVRNVDATSPVPNYSFLWMRFKTYFSQSLTKMNGECSNTILIESNYSRNGSETKEKLKDFLSYASLFPLLTLYNCFCQTFFSSSVPPTN